MEVILKSRKILVWLISFGAIFLIYMLYNRFVATPEIAVQEIDQSFSEIEVPEFGPEAGSIGTTSVESAAKSKYIEIDSETKKVKRIFGFEELFNPDDTSDRWDMKEPYMNIYEEGYRCEITADRGTARVEKVAGKVIPSDTTLVGDVQMQFHFSSRDRVSEGTVYLDDLVYSAERSEFTTEGPVRLVSNDAEMEGTGMLLLYNTRLGRLEFLEIKDLDYLLVRNIEDDTPMSEPAKAAAGPKPESVKQLEADTVETGVAPQQDDSVETTDYYECQINKNVVIEYGNRLVVVGAECVTINNILWMKRASVAKGESVQYASEGIVQNSNIVVKELPGGGVEESKVSDEEMVESEEPLETIVKCQGSVVIKPVNSTLEIPGLVGYRDRPQMRSTANDKIAGLTGVQRFGAGSSEKLPFEPERARLKGSDDEMRFYGVSNLFDAQPLAESYDRLVVHSATFAGGADVENIDTVVSTETVVLGDRRPPAQFHARRIDYDMNTRNALAHGPVKFIFYELVEEEQNVKKAIPIVITAQENAEYFSAENQVVFNGSVVGSQDREKEEYLQKTNVRGERLIVNISSSEDKSTEDETSIEHLTIEGGTVTLDATLNKDDTVIKHIQLRCVKIDYDASDEVIVGTGPGDIQVNNVNSPPVSTDNRLNLEGPCYASISGFDKLEWFILSDKLTAEGESTINLGYLPVVDGQVKGDDVIRAASMAVEVKFAPTKAGQTKLTDMTATGGVLYKEAGRYEFAGDSLFYNAASSILTVKGSDRIPCRLNGGRVPAIEYNMKTGKVKTKLSTTPGSMVMPLSNR